MGTDPTERAFYRAFRDLNPLNDLGIGEQPREAAVSGLALKQARHRDKAAGLGMDRDEHLFSRYGEWRRGKSAAIGIT